MRPRGGARALSGLCRLCGHGRYVTDLYSTLISVIDLTVTKKFMLINDELIMTHSAWDLC